MSSDIIPFQARLVCVPVDIVGVDREPAFEVDSLGHRHRRRGGEPRLDPEPPVLRYLRFKASRARKNVVTASPLHVEPYPPRPQSMQIDATLDTPGRKHLDDVYDR